MISCVPPSADLSHVAETRRLVAGLYYNVNTALCLFEKKKKNAPNNHLCNKAPKCYFQHNIGRFLHSLCQPRYAASWS